MVPSKPIVVIPPEPQAPDLAKQLPKSIRLTAVEARYYQEACDAYELAEEPVSDVRAEYGLGRQESCGWAVDGYTLQDGLTLEYIMIQMADYMERYRAWAQSLVKTINQLKESK